MDFINCQFTVFIKFANVIFIIKHAAFNCKIYIYMSIVLMKEKKPETIHAGYQFHGVYITSMCLIMLTPNQFLLLKKTRK